MDVLRHWQPNIDWAQFQQADISDSAWQIFTAVVQLSHAREYWREAADRAVREPVYRPTHSESAYMNRKRRREKELRIEMLKGHMHRAAYLASEEVAKMSYLPSVAENDGSDHKLYQLLRGAITQHYETGNFHEIAFNSFDPSEHL